jgi:hypothetical protein
VKRRLKIWWINHVLWPLRRRQLRKGTMALLTLNEQMKTAGWDRRRRRQSMRAIFRTPNNLHFMLDLLYSQRGLGRWPR